MVVSKYSGFESETAGCYFAFILKSTGQSAKHYLKKKIGIKGSSERTLAGETGVFAVENNLPDPCSSILYTIRELIQSKERIKKRMEWS